MRRVLRIGTVLDPVEQSVRRTHKGKDDRLWEAEQKRKKQPPMLMPLPDGPCCSRCRHWIEYAEEMACQVTAMVAAYYPENRRFVDLDEMKAEGLMGLPPMRTKPWFVCRQFNRPLDRPLLRIVQPESESEPEWGPLKTLIRQERDDDK